MTGHAREAVIKLENGLSLGGYQVQHGTHQLDFAVQSAFDGHVTESCQGSLHNLISFFRLQTN